MKAKKMFCWIILGFTCFKLQALSYAQDAMVSNSTVLVTNTTSLEQPVIPDVVQVELTPKDIVKKADDLMRGNTSVGTYKMTVKTSNWQRVLELTAYSQDRDKTFIHITSPAKEAGIKTLRIDNNMWNYLPSVERTIKIPPSMMFQSWMGSEFSNDDLVKESSVVNDYTHDIINNETTEFGEAYIIKLTPKPDAAVTWGKILYSIRKNDCVPLKQEFYNEEGKLIKVLQYSNIKQMSDRIIPTLWTMTSMLKESNITVIEVINIVYDQPIDENVFALNNLK